MIKFKNMNLRPYVFLTIIFFSLRLPLLLWYDGILGSDEIYKSIDSILCFLNRGQNCITQFVYPYNGLPFFINTILFLPFFFLLGGSEFYFFFTTLLINLTNVYLAFFLLKKLTNTKNAFLGSLALILTPIGVSIFSISGDIPGRNLILTFFLCILIIFENKKVNAFTKYVLLLILPFLTSPLYVVIIPLYLITYKDELNLKANSIFKKVIFSLSLLALTYPVYKAIQRSILIWREHSGFAPDILNSTFHYFAAPFIGGSGYFDLFKNILPLFESRYESLSFFTLMTFFLFLFFLINLPKGILKDKNNKIFLILANSSLILFLVTALLFFFKLYSAFTEMRPTGTGLGYLYTPILLTLLSTVLLIEKHKSIRYAFYLFLIINLGINFAQINPSKKGTNYLVYDLGNNYKQSPMILPDRAGFNKEDIQRPFTQIFLGYWSREIDPLIINSLFSEEKEFINFGIGLKLYYGNSKGKNFCNILRHKERINACHKGYQTKKEDILGQFTGDNKERDILLKSLKSI